MTKKNWLLPTVLLVLALVYVVFFTDWFNPRTVQIFHTVRTVYHRRSRGNEMPSLIFGINQKLRLTEIKVVPAADFQSNPDVLPLWHLVSDSNSVPVCSFSYGKPIRGMKPAIAGETPQELATNVIYHLIVVAGKIKGEHDFKLK